MAKKPLPSPEVLRQLLRYEPETGKLFWKERGPEWFSDGRRAAKDNAATWNARYSGVEALTAVSGEGYNQGALLGGRYFAHRVIMAMVYGETPEQVDHINGNRQDNRLANLRGVTRQQNQQNKQRLKNNKSGCTGVAWHQVSGKWRSEIKVNNQSLHLGSFYNFDDAVAARKKAEKEHGFHANHGRDAVERS